MKEYTDGTLFNEGRIREDGLCIERCRSSESIEYHMPAFEKCRVEVFPEICEKMECSQALVSHHLTDMLAKGILLIRGKDGMPTIDWQMTVSRTPCGV